MLQKQKRQTNIKVAAENFFDDCQVGFKLSVSAIVNDDEYRKQNFSYKPKTRVMDNHSLSTVKVETKMSTNSFIFVCL